MRLWLVAFFFILLALIGFALDLWWTAIKLDLLRWMGWA